MNWNKGLFNVLIFVISFFSVNVQASSQSEANEARAEARYLIVKAIEKGLQQVDGVSLGDILKKIDALPPVRIMKNIYVNEEGRQGGYYYTGQYGNDVFINPEILATTAVNERAPWMLHELLGAAGIGDRNFQKTMQILFANLKPWSQKEQTVLESLNQERKLILVAGGGATSVGGGGDPQIIAAKRRVFEYLNLLGSQGQQSLDGIDLQRLARIALDCDFKFYQGKNAIFSESFLRDFHKPGETHSTKIIERPWVTINIRRDWITSDKVEESLKLKLLMDALLMQAKANSVEFCQPPPAGYLFLYDNRASSVPINQ